MLKTNNKMILFVNTFYLVNFPHSMRGQVLLQVGGGGKGFLTELTLPGFVLVVDPLYVHPHVVTPHELLITMRTRHTGCPRPCPRPALLLLGGRGRGGVGGDHQGAGLHRGLHRHLQPLLSTGRLLYNTPFRIK